jgi:hypothetical protein
VALRRVEDLQFVVAELSKLDRGNPVLRGAAAAAGALVGSAISAARHDGRPAVAREAGPDKPTVPEWRASRPVRRATPRRRTRIFLTIGAVLARAGAAVAAAFHTDIAVGGLLLTSLALSGVAVRGPSLTGKTRLILRGTT